MEIQTLRLQYGKDHSDITNPSEQSGGKWRPSVCTSGETGTQTYQNAAHGGTGIEKLFGLTVAEWIKGVHSEGPHE